MQRSRRMRFANLFCPFFAPINHSYHLLASSTPSGSRVLRDNTQTAMVAFHDHDKKVEVVLLEDTKMYGVDF